MNEPEANGVRLASLADIKCLRIYGLRIFNGEKVFLPLEDWPILKQGEFSEIEQVRLELVIADSPGTCPNSDGYPDLQGVLVESQLRIRGNANNLELSQSPKARAANQDR